MQCTDFYPKGITMRTSARNNFAGFVKDIAKGPVSTEVMISVAPNVDVVATISTRSADTLGLAVGKPAYALIKASSVIVCVD
jgi:molybdate transport system regulatory protein